ncbi:MAG: hypothetical protein RBT75_02775 [Anaerolineae bacterium]|nr:hypothetical protein [Anaerolineae bacterium]
MGRGARDDACLPLEAGCRTKIIITRRCSRAIAARRAITPGRRRPGYTATSRERSSRNFQIALKPTKPGWSLALQAVAAAVAELCEQARFTGRSPVAG